MRLLVLFAFAALTLSFMPDKKLKVIFFGDSITEAGVKPGGYITVLDSMAKKSSSNHLFEFIGRGISGNKVYDLLFRLEDDVISMQPDLVVIYIGINDVWHKSLAGTGTDTDRFERFYQEIIDQLKKKNIQVILCTPTVIGEKTDYSNPQDGDLNEYSNIIRQLASKNKLPLIDLRNEFLAHNLKNNPANAPGGVLTTDRVHLNAKGNMLVAQSIWKVISNINL
ncbi:MAG: SGNH/GDSL hydrolase family protein [Chitinophagaceae bacterium]|nr:SGNH/GDSL hydrolase family protein [Chitinophagaceae bacterium]